MSPGANEGATPFFVYILGRLLEHNLITIFTCYVLDVDCRRVFRAYLVRFLRPRGRILGISATLTSRGLRPFNMIPATATPRACHVSDVVAGIMLKGRTPREVKVSDIR